MATINTNYNKLVSGYLFQEIARRTKNFTEKHPDVTIMKLGIGNTTEPLSPTVITGLHSGVKKLDSVETYTGYGDYEGEIALRKAIGAQYKKRGVTLDPSEIFVSDGAKPDSGNIQSIFGIENIVGVQDPAYPVYVDTNVIAGRTGQYNHSKGIYEGLIYMPCNENNNFFPDLPDKKIDLLYLCSPNNPTGNVATKEQLKQFIDYAIENQSIIIFDAAYSAFIQEAHLPRTIYEVEGARHCAIEINSFSKVAGFTGVRLGWAIVPQEVKCENATAGQINSLWRRRQSTFFNGPSNIVQEGGLASLSEQGQKECQALVNYYMHNAKLIREGLQSIGLKAYGGHNGPYIWLKTPNNLSSWNFFDKLFDEAHVVGTPGSGFGPSGEGFFRLSAFGHHEDVEKAVKSIQENLKLNN